MGEPDIAVLRQKIHGLDASDYAEILRSRLPDREIAFAETPADERDLLQRARIATGRVIDIDDVGPDLELFACVFAGTDHLPLDDLADRGVAVTNASGVHGPNIAEYVLGGILAMTRGFDRAMAQQRRREWRSFPAMELQGSTVAVVGLGALGTTVVDRLEPFGVDTIGVRYSPEKGGPTDEVCGFDEVHEAFARADYLVLATPLTDETAGLVDRDAFESLPPSSVVVNVARGGVVDTDALVWALRTNRIRGAVIDVTDPEPLPEDHPLWGFGNVIVTPHNAGHTPKYYDRLADIVVENVNRLDAGEEDFVNQVV